MPRRNLVLNPTFGGVATGPRLSPTGWTVTGYTGTPYIGDDAGTPQSPNYWAGNSTAGTTNVRPSATVATTVGVRHTFSMWVYRATTGSVRLDIDWHDAADAYTGGSSSASTSVTGGVWTRISTSGVAPAGSARGRPWVAFLSMASNTLWGVDGALFEQDADATPGSYFDGDTPGFRWEGTAHASFSTDAPADVRSGTGWAAGIGLSARGAGPRKGIGTGWSSRVGLSARASGPKTGIGSGNARHGLAASAAGTARRESHGDARLGLSGMAAGAKTGIGTGWAPPIGLLVAGAGAKLAHGLGEAPPIGLGAYATPPLPVPQFTGRSLPEDPLPLAQSRYLVQNILTGRWLHTDLPLSNDTVKRTLSGPCEIAGDITPEYADLKTDEGGPLLRSWGHVVYLEMDGEIRAAGLITEDSYDDQTQSLVCQGVSAYPAQIAYQGAYRRYFADPVTVAEQMWAYVQSFPNGNLGVQVTRTGGVPPVLYGAKVNPVPGDRLLGMPYAPRPQSGDDQDPPTLPVRQANTLPGVWARLMAMGYKPRNRADTTKPATGDNQVTPDTTFVRKADLERAYTDYLLTPGQPQGLTMAYPPDVTSQVTIDPFKVDWWDVKKCGEIIDEAIKALPGDYVEQYEWNFPHTFVDQRVLFAYPRLGRRRDDLRFVQGENIVEPVRLESDPDGFATAVIGIGAGEGSAALRETAEVLVPGVVRKTYVYRNTKITDRTTLRRLVTDELLQRSTGGYDIPSIVVRASHENAVFGSYSEGDDIYVQADVAGYGWVGLWCRVMAMTLSRGTDLVDIALRRSDSFMYGREVESS